jgi:hypothetical protein
MSPELGAPLTKGMLVLQTLNAKREPLHPFLRFNSNPQKAVILKGIFLSSFALLQKREIIIASLDA